MFFEHFSVLSLRIYQGSLTTGKCVTNIWLVAMGEYRRAVQKFLPIPYKRHWSDMSS